MPYNVATLQRSYKVKLPERVKQFIEHELSNYEHATLVEPLDDLLPDFTIVVIGTEHLFDPSSFFDRRYRPGRIPLAALANKRGHWRAEIVMVHCATGAIDFGRGTDHGDDDPPKMRRIAKNLDGFLEHVRRPKAAPDRTFATIRTMLQACKRATFHVRETATTYEVRHAIHKQWPYMAPFAQLAWKRGRTTLRFYPLVNYNAVRKLVTPALAAHQMSERTGFAFEGAYDAKALSAVRRMIELGERVWYIEPAV